MVTLILKAMRQILVWTYFFANAEDMYEQQILSAEDAEAKLLEEALAKMNEDNAATRAVGYTTRVGSWENYSTFAPLVKVNWGQRSPYNDNAPIVNGSRAAAGCTATAIAQIMSYHQYPKSYNWTEINKYSYPSSTIAKTEVARMFRTIGDNVKMNWGAESGAWVYDAPIHFQRMGYRNTGNYSGYNFQRIINSITNGVPVIMSGYAIQGTYSHKHWFLGKRHTHTTYKQGHAWVIDGYLSRRRKVDVMSGTTVMYSYYQYEQLLHCNYGWNGSSNGYYNNAAFDTNKGPETRSGQPYNYQFKLETLYDVKPF
jgi:Peptidase C10 family.